MAANRIKGITIEIGGDTTKLDKALAGTNEQLKSTEYKLKDVERLLKIDPGNIALLAQKNRLLAQSAEADSDKFKTLKKTAEESTVSNVRYEKWQKSFAALQGHINKTSNELSDLEKEAKKLEGLGFAPDSAPMVEVQQNADALRKKMDSLQKKVSDTFEELGRPISIEQWDSLQRELSETEKKMEKAEKAAKTFNAEAASWSGTLSDFSGKAGDVASALAPVTNAVLGLGGAAIATVPATEEFRSDLSMLENNARIAGVGILAARDAFQQFVSVSNEADSSVEAVSNLLQAGFTESNLQMAVENLAGAALSFPDTLKIESLADSLQETIATGNATGQFAEALERLGVNVEEFNKQMAETPTEVGRQDVALAALANNGMKQAYDSWTKNNEALIQNRESTLQFQQAMADLAEDIQPALTSLAEMASSFLNWFNDLPSGAKAAAAGIVVFLGVISPIAGIISTITGALAAAGIASTTFSIAGQAVTITMGQWVIIIAVVVAAVLALVAAIALLTGKSKDIKNIDLPEVPDYSSAVPGNGGGRPRSSVPSATSLDVPHLARGTVTRPNNPFMAVVGDNPTEPEVISPYSTIRRAAQDAMAAGGRSGPVSVSITFGGDLAQLARVLNPHIEVENQRLGPNLVN